MTLCLLQLVWRAVDAHITPGGWAIKGSARNKQHGPRLEREVRAVGTRNDRSASLCMLPLHSSRAPCGLVCVCQAIGADGSGPPPPRRHRNGSGLRGTKVSEWPDQVYCAPLLPALPPCVQLSDMCGLVLYQPVSLTALGGGSRGVTVQMAPLVGPTCPSVPSADHLQRRG
jgi:hypothetical protein